MLPEKFKGELETAVKSLEQAENERLSDLYSLPPDKLMERESSDLIRYALELPLAAQKSVEQVLEAERVPYIHTLWRRINEKLPVISYCYVKWELLEEIVPKRTASKGQKIFGINLVRGDKKVDTSKKPKGKYTAEQLINEAKDQNCKALQLWCKDLINNVYTLVDL